MGATSEDDLSCRACLCSIGETCIAGSRDCITCLNGTYAAEVGASECTDCELGKWSTIRSATCQICPSGEIPNSEKTACETCRAGTYSISGDSSCTPCNDNEVSADHSANCSPCNPGTIPVDNVCTNCAASTYAPFGNSTCSACNFPGQYSTAGAMLCSVAVGGKKPNSNRTGVEDCSEDTFSEGGVDVCTSCTANSYSNPGSIYCYSCIPGQRYDSGSGAANKCVDCGVNEFNANGEGGSCSACDANSYSVGRLLVLLQLHPRAALRFGQRCCQQMRRLRSKRVQLQRERRNVHRVHNQFLLQCRFSFLLHLCAWSRVRRRHDNLRGKPPKMPAVPDFQGFGHWSFLRGLRRVQRLR